MIANTTQLTRTDLARPCFGHLSAECVNLIASVWPTYSARSLDVATFLWELSDLEPHDARHKVVADAPTLPART